MRPSRVGVLIGMSVAVGAVGLATACSGSSGSSATLPTSSPTGAASPTAVPSAVQAALTQRLGLAAKLHAEKDSAAPNFQTAEDYLANDTDATDAASLRAEGLQAVVTQHLTVPGTLDAVRSILVFGAASGAQQDLQRVSKATPANGDKLTSAAVASFPGAVATTFAHGDGTVVGRNVMFTAGTDEYIVGIAPQTGKPAPPSTTALANVAAAWYAKVKSLA